MAFSDMVSGASEWMATVEGRSGDEWEGGGEVRTLKLWRWDGERQVSCFPDGRELEEADEIGT